MVVTRDARVIGSLTGGCIESDAVLMALQALNTGQTQSAIYGAGLGAEPELEDRTAAGSLACGGTVEVLAYRLTPGDAVAIEALESVLADRRVAVGLVTSGPDAGTFVSVDPTDHAVCDGVGTRMMPGAHQPLGAHEGDILLLTHDPRQRLVILGAGEHAVALARVAAAAEFAVTVCDTSALMATRERFPDAAEVVVGDPAEYLARLAPEQLRTTALCVLTHDERVDVPALSAALGLPFVFIGAMGSRSTVERRQTLLREAGHTPRELTRLRTPIGLDLGGSSTSQTALSILAEIVAVRHGATARPLRRLTGPVHRAVSAPHPALPHHAAAPNGRVA